MKARSCVTSSVEIGGEPEGVTVRPGGREVYVTCEENNDVYAVRTSTFDIVGRMKTAARRSSTRQPAHPSGP